MGKRTRKTRWRTLPIAGDEQSDSEESNSTLDTRLPPTYHQKYYNRFTYSSQSTPTRRYQSDSTKSTRSSSTASENKITFNEDEYTRITTPRQDVLFKKGYLNKPKTYSTQTSTGNSTTSTGNSTGNGTPDYQSTDLDYESHFVFPNGFLDQNGIYYVNSYDPYPLMVYNAPTYYNDSWSRSKKYSTESLAETSSTTNEEISQDKVNQNGGNELQHTPPPSQINGHPHHPPNMPPPTEYAPMYNVVYPGFYYNGLCPPQDLVNGQCHQSETKRIKRRKRRKDSLANSDGQQQDGTTSEYTEDEISSTEDENKVDEKTSVENSDVLLEENSNVLLSSSSSLNENSEAEAQIIVSNGLSNDSNSNGIISNQVINIDYYDNNDVENITPDSQSDSNGHQSILTNTAENSLNLSDANTSEKKVKYDLKPDAQEFIPRAMRPENLQYYKIPPNFVPVPLLSPIGAQNYNHPYLPPGIPINFIHQNHPMYPGYVPGYGPPNFNLEQIQSPTNEVLHEETQQIDETADIDTSLDVKNKGDIDIQTVVSKLEEVANEPPKPEETVNVKNQHIPNKQNLPFRQQKDDRKKFNKTKPQNGFYQRKSFNNDHQQIHFKEEIVQEVQEPVEINTKQPVITNGISANNKDTIPVEMAKKLELHSDVKNLETISEILHKSPEQKKIEIEQKEKLIKADKPQFENAKEIPTTNGRNQMSPKFQSRNKENIENTPKLMARDSNNFDYKKRWPKRDDRNVQRKDQYHDEKSNPNYKKYDSPSHKFNKRFDPNSPTKRQNQNTVSVEYAKKYSDTVKRLPQSLPTQTKESLVINKEIKPVIPEVTNTPITNKTQWISVSSKKKRRNRNIDDTEENVEVFDSEESKEIENDAFEKNTFLQNIINGHSNIEDVSSKEQIEEKIEQNEEVVPSNPVKILEVRDLEKKLLSSVGVNVKEEKIMEKPKSTKKKSKKVSQQPTTKRVIITDIDLSENKSDSKTDEIKDTKQKDKNEEINKVEEQKIEEPVIEPKIIESNIEVDRVEPDVILTENLEKKSKKKKKKQSKTSDVTSCNTSSNNCEDRYDFLLENTFSNNSDDKTNLEISQELDLIIQRGMYSNLEEKIKSLNIIPVKEEFFQSVVRNSREPSMEKSPEFSKFLANSMPKFKYCMASVEDNITSKVSLNNLDQPSTSKNGLFVENLEVNEILKDIYGKEGSPETEIGEIIKKVSPPRDIVMEITKENDEKNDMNKSNDKQKLYPITQAVKNWMTKTRENTPEVEILKSPSVIFKEFCEKSSDEENGTVVINKRNSAIFESDEEVTVYSASRNNSDGVDLLDCWENEISIDSNRKSSNEDGCEIDVKNKSDKEEVDDVLEVYESKYGQNEDFLQLQKEIEEKTKQETDARSRNFPKHGALPYRAICCSIM